MVWVFREIHEEQLSKFLCKNWLLVWKEISESLIDCWIVVWLHVWIRIHTWMNRLKHANEQIRWMGFSVVSVKFTTHAIIIWY